MMSKLSKLADNRVLGVAVALAAFAYGWSEPFQAEVLNDATQLLGLAVAFVTKVLRGGFDE